MWCLCCRWDVDVGFVVGLCFDGVYDGVVFVGVDVLVGGNVDAHVVNCVLCVVDVEFALGYAVVVD